jgi:hypothetical protein
MKTLELNQRPHGTAIGRWSAILMIVHESKAIRDTRPGSGEPESQAKTIPHSRRRQIKSKVRSLGAGLRAGHLRSEDHHTKFLALKKVNIRAVH